MSLLPAEVHAALGQLTQALQSTDNVTRTQAEDQLTADWVNAQPDVCLMGLVEQIHAGDEPGVKSFAAVLFRRISSRTRTDPTTNSPKDLFLTLQEGSRDAIRARLLEAWGKEQSSNIRNKIGDSVAEIARQYTDEGISWNELLGALFQASQSTDAGAREGAFRIFATTPGIIEKQHEEAVQAAFVKGFKDDDVSVRLTAMEAFSAFFQSITKKAQQKYFALIPEILNILPPIKDSGDSDELSRALVSLIELAEAAPKMFRPQFNNLVTFSVTVIQDKELDDQARQNALELMATFADNNPQMCKKDPSYVSEMVTQCLSLMTDVGADDDEAQEWADCEDLDTDESDMNHVAGEQTMDRLANKLGGPLVLPPTFTWLPRMMTSSAWRDRHAALMAISAISEGCADLMVGELDKVLDLVVPALRDPHPRVRWAGCNALGQMSTDFSGTMQSQYHQIVLPNIIPVLESAEPRVQAHAAAALVNFSEEAEQSILEPYLDNLLSHLLQLLRAPKRFVQEQALSTIATVADSAEAAFARYYDTLMPLLFNVLREEQSKEYRLLRAKAMECATLIALAVGKERMGQDAVELVAVLAHIQNNIVDSDDPQASYLLHCWGRMCRVMGQDFVPYLAGVMPPLIEVAASQADIHAFDSAEEAGQVDPEEGWDLIPVKGKVLGIRVSVLDDKSQAIELVAIYASTLEAAFEPYVMELVQKVVIPGLTFYFHDPVRVTSTKCVPALVNCYAKAHGHQNPQVRQLFDHAVENVLAAIKSESMIDILAELFGCFYETVDVMGKDCLSSEQMAEFVARCEAVLKEYQSRFELRQKERADNQDAEGDEDEDEELMYAIENDQVLLSDMNKAFHTVFKHHTSTFLPHWERLAPFCSAFATNPEPTQRQWAVCVFDDVLEFTGAQSWAYSNQIIQPLVAGLQDDVPANRQASAYGVGVAAQKGGEAWADFAAASLPMLFQVTQRPGAREGDDAYATENASAAIAKVLHFNSAKVPNVPEVVAAWLETLPVINDDEAAPYAYSFLAQLIDQQNPAVLAKAAPCFLAIARALEAETLQGQTASRVVGAAKQLVASAGLDANQLLVASFAPDAQAQVMAWFT